MNADRAVDQAVRRTAGVLGAAAVLAAGLWLISGIATVEPGNRAVVLRWGAVERVVASGLILAWPRPIETIVRIPGAERTQTSEVGILAAPTPTHMGTAGCLTGDAGLVHLAGSVVWTVEDPIAYITITRDGDETRDRGLERAFAASAIAVCASRNVDGVLVVGSSAGDDRAVQSRERLRGDLLAGLNQRLSQLGLGVRAQRVDLAVTLPEAARPAFAEVLTAAQTAERTVAEARTQAERQRQDTVQFRAQRLGQASAFAHELVSRAKVATDSIAALAQEHDPDRQYLLRQRLWYERLEALLRKSGQVIAIPRSRPMKLWLSGNSP